MNSTCHGQFGTLLSYFALLTSLVIFGCVNESERKNHKYTNDLIHETSPYLQQHAHNPVNWMPWGEAAFEKAQKENKLLLISIGYSSCHWCHVMESESFEDTVVANLMNRHFVPVKVDREERPDVDNAYMTAIQLLTGSGGWPLNAFALPDGKPVYGGTYFPKDKWIALLNQLKTDYHKDPDKFKKYAENLAKGVQQSNLVPAISDSSSIAKPQVESAFSTWMTLLDHQWGGMASDGVKFPNPANLNAMLHWAIINNDTQWLSQVELTLDKMEQGGIYDQIGGGFSRYSTDRFWTIPHFEKMLYDNAQLIELYANAYKVFKKERYKEVFTQTVAFLEREMKSDKGGYYAAMDADSEGEEGAYYCWTEKSLKEMLGDVYPEFSDYHLTSTKGKWEANKIVLQRNPDRAKSKALLEAQKLALEARMKRIPPEVDHKILTSWNAMLISGLCQAYTASGDPSFKEKAVNLSEFLVSNLIKEKQVWHSWQKDGPKIHGFLDDYAQLSNSMFNVFAITGNSKWVEIGLELIEQIELKFGDTNDAYFYYADANNDELFTRDKAFHDHVMPSSNAVMADLLWKAGHLTGNGRWTQQSVQMVQGLRTTITNSPNSAGHWINLAISQISPYYEIAIVGPNSRDQYQQLAKRYLPDVLWAWTAEPAEHMNIFKGRYVADQSLIYICQNQSCLRPIHDVESALARLRNSSEENKILTPF